jgi:CBS domain containing-hemolysin-like protein
MLEAHETYQRFPVTQEGRYAGLVSRAELLEALEEGREPVYQKEKGVPRTIAIRDAQMHLIESDHGMVVMVDETSGKPIGLLTLHDLLRTEVNLGDTYD